MSLSISATHTVTNRAIPSDPPCCSQGLLSENYSFSLRKKERKLCMSRAYKLKVEITSLSYNLGMFK